MMARMAMNSGSWYNRRYSITVLILVGVVLIHLTEFNGQLFFGADDGENGDELGSRMVQPKVLNYWQILILVGVVLIHLVLPSLTDNYFLGLMMARMAVNFGLAMVQPKVLNYC